MGFEVVMEEGDKCVIFYCDYGYMLVCGMDFNGVMVEFMG